MRSHWHITYRVLAGYRVIDSVPFPSKIECDFAIAAMPWSAKEQPEAREFAGESCAGIYQEAAA